MRILSLDTSGERCSVAVASGTLVQATCDFRHERRLSERLHGIMDFVLRDIGHTLQDIEAVAVGLGPGSFTGVRVGVTVAKTLALVRDVPVVGVSSLTALVEPVRSLVRTPIVAVVPTRRTESIAAFYAPGTLEPLLSPQVYANDSVVEIARRHFGVREILLLGEAAGVILEATPDDDLRAHVASPTADSVARLAVERLMRGERDEADALVPLYIAPSPVG